MNSTHDYQDIDFGLATTLSPGASLSLSTTGGAQDDFRTGTSDQGLTIRPAKVDGAVDSVFFNLGIGASAFALNLHDLFDTTPTEADYRLEILVNNTVAFDTGSTPAVGDNDSAAIGYSALIAGTSTSFPAIGSAVTVGDDSNGFDGTFIGFTASPSSAITSVQLRYTTIRAGDGRDNWSFDHVLIVPEPSRAMLLMTGLLAGAVRRRR